MYCVSSDTTGMTGSNRAGTLQAGRHACFFKVSKEANKKVPEHTLRDRDIVITTLFFHPDYTVGTGVSPIQPARVSRVADFTASEESHLALKNYF